MGDHEIYNFLSRYPTDATNYNLIKIGPASSSWEEDVNARTDDDGHQPIAIGHLSDSSDLKILKHENTTTLFKTVHLTF